jgi:hypothetical protein
MNDEILSRIRGQKISGFSFVRYPHLGLFERVILHLESGLAFEFRSREFKFGPYEAYKLEAVEFRGKTGTERIDAGWTVARIDAFERQDWLEPADKNVKTIGNNPTSHAWGAIGAAPAHASHAIIVTSSITFSPPSGDRQAMIYLADYPGLVGFTAEAGEMASVRKAHGGG